MGGRGGEGREVLQQNGMDELHKSLKACGVGFRQPCFSSSWCAVCGCLGEPCIHHMQLVACDCSLKTDGADANGRGAQGFMAYLVAGTGGLHTLHV